MVNEFKEKIENKTLKIGIVGLGYVGLPLAVEFALTGLTVTGFDIDEPKCNAINSGITTILDVKENDLHEVLKNGHFKAVTDFSFISKMDAVSICVPTPLRKTKDPDMSYILSALAAMIPYLKKGQLIVLESTTYPGTTEEILLPELQKAGFTIGEDMFLAYSPERVDPGNRFFKTKNTPKVLGGYTQNCTDIATMVYKTAIDTVVPVANTKTAEMVKLLENTYRAVNIGLANELAIMCDKLDVDVWDVIEAASTKPFGFSPFFPGPGLGGHCIPIDPAYLSWKLKTLDYDARFIALAESVNRSMPDYVVRKATEILNNYRRPISGSKILLFGMAYKPDVSDTREAPNIDILAHLKKLGAYVTFHDPFVDSVEISGLGYQNSIRGVLDYSWDLIIILTKHSFYKNDIMTTYLNDTLDKQKPVLDCVNLLKKSDSLHAFRL